MESQKNYPDSSKKKFIDHVLELESRGKVYFLVLCIGSVIGYLLKDYIILFLLAPINQPLYFSSPAGGFSFVFSLSLFFGFLVSLPIFIFQILSFIEPIIPKRQKYFMIATIMSSLLLMLLGILFGYYVSLPAALHFLATFSGDEVKSLISTSEYFSFVTRYLIGFGLLFQLPLIMVFINSIYRLSFSTLLRFEKWVVVVSFVVAAIITPTPDIVNQLVMAVPIIILYQLSVIIVWCINRT